MRYYVFDQLLFLGFGISFMVFASYEFIPLIALLIDIIIVVVWGRLCRGILLLPFDLMLGKKQKQVYFCCQTGVESYEFFRNRNAFKWKFRYGEEHLIELLYPLSVKKAENLTINKPSNDQKVMIEYYKFSKVLVRWEPIGECEDQPQNRAFIER